MKSLRALIIIGVLVVLVLSTSFIGSGTTILYIPLDVFFLWVLFIVAIPVVWYLAIKVEVED